MLRVSDVWERALHAPGVALSDLEEDSVLPEHLAELDAFPIASGPHDPAAR